MKFHEFQRVLVRNNATWHADIYSHYVKSKGVHFCVGGVYRECMPHNVKTKRFLGTPLDPSPKDLAEAEAEELEHHKDNLHISPNKKGRRIKIVMDVEVPSQIEKLAEMGIGTGKPIMREALVARFVNEKMAEAFLHAWLNEFGE